MGIEADIRAIGLDLLRDVRARRPRLGTRSWVDAQGLNLTLADPALAGALFRLVDTLPCLPPGRAVVEQARGLLDRAEGPGAARLAALLSLGWPPALVDRVVRGGVGVLADRFLAAPERVPERLRSLAEHGQDATLDWLGEAVLSDVEASSYATTVAGLIRHAGRWSRPGMGQVSLKVSALTPWLEPADPLGTAARILERLLPLARQARDAGVGLNIDMEATPLVETTLAVVRGLGDASDLRHWSGLAVAVQAYLRRTPEDLAALHAWAQRRGTPLGIRLVKGAYWDQEVALARQRDWPCPVWTTRGATDAAYERVIPWLLERSEVLRPAFASHNIRTVAAVLAQRRGHPVEFQVLTGMADPLARTLAERGERVRVYVPVGHLLPGMAYLVRRLLENGSSQGFVRQSVVARPAELLRAPHPLEPPQGRPAMFINAAPTDFTDPARRAAVQAALAAVPLGGDHPARIDGRALPAPDWMTRHDPADTACVVGRVAASSADQATLALDALAASPWPAVPLTERIAVVERAADLLARDRDRFIAVLVREIGKTWREADAEVAEAEDFCRYYAAEAQLMERIVALPGEMNRTVWDPRGVVVVISPWNFPLAILTGMAVAGLVMGNPVLLKPAEQASVVASHLVDLLLAAGLPSHAVAFLPGRGEEVGPALTAHPRLGLIAFTGSQAVGRLLVQAVAVPVPGRSHLVPVVCEMGGKNAIIVDVTADLDEAVAGVVASATGFQGQKCSACSRVIVHHAVWQPFCERLRGHWATLVYGVPADPGHGLGPVVDDETAQRLRRATAALTHPIMAQVVPPPALVARGHYVPATVVGPVGPHDPVAQDEWFGPVLAVIPAQDLDEALAIANGTAYALTGGCYARSPAVLERVSREFRVGNLYLNRGITGALVHRQPFGGFRGSGIGSKAGGPEYLHQFAVPRVICEHTLRHGMVDGGG